MADDKAYKRDMLARSHAEYHNARVAIESMRKAMGQSGLSSEAVELTVLLDRLHAVDLEVVTAYGHIVIDLEKPTK